MVVIPYMYIYYRLAKNIFCKKKDFFFFKMNEFLIGGPAKISTIIQGKITDLHIVIFKNTQKTALGKVCEFT